MCYSIIGMASKQGWYFFSFSHSVRAAIIPGWPINKTGIWNTVNRQASDLNSYYHDWGGGYGQAEVKGGGSESSREVAGGFIIMPRPEMEGWITLPTKAMILFHTTLAEFEAGNYGWLESDFPTLLEQSRMQYWQSQYDIRYIKILIYRNISTFFQFCHYAIARKNWTGSGGYNWCREIWQGSIKYVGLTWSRAGGVPHGLVPAPWDGMFRKQMDSRRSCRIRPVRSSPSPCKEITRTSSEPGITINHIQFSCSLGKQTSSH